MANPKRHTQPDTASKAATPRHCREANRSESSVYDSLIDIESDRRIQRVEDAMFLGSFLRGSRAQEA